MQFLDGLLELRQAFVGRVRDRQRHRTLIEQAAHQIALRFAEIRILQRFVESADQRGQPAGTGARSASSSSFVETFIGSP